MLIPLLFITMYIKANKPVEKIVSDNATFLKKKKINLEVNDINKKRNICWISNLHVYSSKARFIIVAP